MISSENLDYKLFLKFFESFAHAGVKGIASDHPIIKELDYSLNTNNQVMYISDAILMEILFLSSSIKTMFGIEPSKVTSGYFLTTSHPDDQKRHQSARAKLLCMAHELYGQKNGNAIMSINVRARKPNEDYFPALYQACLFNSNVPYESVFLILVITDISKFKTIHKGFHYYIGNDPKLFRYPDNELLMTGNMFSDCEFKIIELIEQGLSSKEIAEKLFRSVHTINTHRSNILEKSEKFSITEVIYDLKSQGLL